MYTQIIDIQRAFAFKLLYNEWSHVVTVLSRTYGATLLEDMIVI